MIKITLTLFMFILNNKHNFLDYLIIGQFKYLYLLLLLLNNDLLKSCFLLSFSFTVVCV